MATLRGEPVDRPPVSFYELNGLDENPSLDDPFNIYTHASWKPLIELTKAKTDRIVMRGVPFLDSLPDAMEERATVETWMDEAGSLFKRVSLRVGKRTLTSLTRRDRDVNTVWTIDHLLKNVEDLKAFLELPAPEGTGKPDIGGVIQAEAAIGDTGIVMIDTPDALCKAAELFHLADFITIAFSEEGLFRQLLDWFAGRLAAQTEAVAGALPGRLWRIYGPEYASPPYLPPHLFKEYAIRYDTPMVETIQRRGGYARIHCHGRLKKILDLLVETGCSGLDPIEPPPQGDVELSYVRERYGSQLVLFGNLEASDIETLPTDLFREKVNRALLEGTQGEGRGFVLMPSACPYGRELSELALANYRCMIEEVERVYGE